MQLKCNLQKKKKKKPIEYWKCSYGYNQTPTNESDFGI